MTQTNRVTKSVKARNAFIYRLAMNGKHAADEIIKLAGEIDWSEADDDANAAASGPGGVVEQLPGKV